MSQDLDFMYIRVYNTEEIPIVIIVKKEQKVKTSGNCSQCLNIVETSYFKEEKDKRGFFRWGKQTELFDYTRLHLINHGLISA